MNVSLALGFGLVSASILALGAVGFTLQFGMTNVLNLSYGQVMTVGMYVAYLVNVTAGGSIWLSLAAGAVAGALVSALLNLMVFRPFLHRGASPATLIIVSVGIGTVIENTLLAAAGPDYRSFNQPQTRSVSFLGMTLTTEQIAIIAIAVAVMVGVHLLLRYTRLGKSMRATSANLDLARTSGIATDRVTMTAWIVFRGIVWRGRRDVCDEPGHIPAHDRVRPAADRPRRGRVWRRGPALRSDAGRSRDWRGERVGRSGEPRVQAGLRVRNPCPDAPREA